MATKELVKCKKCGAENAADAKICPKCGTKTHTLRETISAGIFATVIVAGIALKVCGGDDSTKATPAEATRADESSTKTSPSPPTAFLPWLVEADKKCQALKAGVNDIQKNKLFSAFAQSLHSFKVESATGKLSSLQTIPGGSDAELEIEVAVSAERRITFFNSLLDHSVVRGSSVFKAIENMPIGACVVVSPFVWKLKMAHSPGCEATPAPRRIAPEECAHGETYQEPEARRT